MGIAIFAFVVIFLLIASGGLLLFYREAMLQRIADVINPQPKPKTLLGTIQQAGLVGQRGRRALRARPAQEPGGGFGRRAAPDPRRLPQGLGGQDLLRHQGDGARSCCAFVALVTGLAEHQPVLRVRRWRWWSGFLGPDFWLGRQITKRQGKIRRGLPDVLDLLVICIEAGLSLDQATARTAQELTKAQPELCDELNLVVLEQRAGRPARGCLEAPGRAHRCRRASATWSRCWCSRSSSAPASPRPCASTPTP